MARKKTAVQSREGTIGKDLTFAVAEAYKRLRTNLMFSFSGDEDCHVVGVTSSLRGEGKSTTSTNLAYSIAEAGKKVLLIEADMRLPQFHTMMKTKLSPGLSNLLVGENNGENLIQSSGLHDNLHVISAGDISPNPTELLSSRRFVNVIEALKARYDYILIDLPPIEAVADALIVSKVTHGMLIVVRENYVTKQVLANTVRQLQYHRANILGFVQNFAEAEGKYYKKHYYKKNKYYNQYYYKSSDDRTSNREESSHDSK